MSHAHTNNGRTLIYSRLLVSRSTILLFVALAISATSIQNFRLIKIISQDDVGSVLLMSMGAAIHTPSNITSISSANGSKAQQALNFLVRENGFTKVDDLLKKKNASIDKVDSGMLAIYDLILASKSMNFATCARGGGHGCTNKARRLCEECNHVGKFGKLALSFRSDNEKGSSWACWPARSLDKFSFIGNGTAWRLFFDASTQK